MEKLASELGAESPEQLFALLSHLEGQEGGLESVSPDLAELMRNVKKEKGERTEEVPTQEIEPEPGFVVKTQDLNTQRKVFINMCGHASVAAPGNWEGGVMPESVQNALENVDNLTEAEAGTLRFPLSMSTLREETDKKGEPCTTLDCCLNIDVIHMAAKHRPLKSFIIELAVNWVGHKHKMELDMKYKLPKMRYKGEVVETQRIRVDKKPLVTEVKDVPEEPTFALRATKAPPPEQQQQQQQQQRQQPVPSQQVAGGVGAAQSSSTGVGGSSSSGRGVDAQLVGPGPSSSGFKLVGPVECHGRPVESMSFAAELPPSLQEQLLTEGRATLQGVQAVAARVRVEACGRDVLLGAPGCQELRVGLPFAASTQAPSVQLEPPSSRDHPAKLHVRLCYASLQELLAQAAAQKPHDFGQLGLASSAALELEP